MTTEPQDTKAIYEKVIAGFDERDLQIIRSALAERHGFDSRVFTEAYAIFGVDIAGVEEHVKSLKSPTDLNDLSKNMLLGCFAACSLASAALGEEELHLITGFTVEEYYLTIRRIYHAVRSNSKV